MIHTKIRIQSIEDAKNGVPVIEGLTGENVKMCKDVTVVILEGGMQSGGTSIMFVLKDEDGKHYIGETSAKMFGGIAAAVKGACMSFDDSEAVSCFI